MLIAATVLGVSTVGQFTGPWILLALTFCIGLGNALNAPAWQATTPELVPRNELPGAVALSAVSVNVARAVGPALGGVLVAAMGAGWVFLLNAASFVAVIGVLVRWERTSPAASRLPPEDVPGAMRAGVRYVRHSAPFRAVLVRSAAFVVPASAVWALLPLFARRALELSALGYGVLLGCLGLGALLGVVLLPTVRDRVTSDRLLVVSTLVFAAMSTLLAVAHVPVVAGVALLVAGVAWIGAMSTLTVAAQNAVPAWVRGRALAVGLLAVQGGLATGGVVWGVVATHAGIPAALVAGAVGLVLAAVATMRFELHGLSNLNLLPDTNWTRPETAWKLEGDEGPVLVTLDYDVSPEDVDEFLRAVKQLEPVRRRDGAIRWNVYHDIEEPRRWVEVFVVESWLEHLRQHERGTASDRIVRDSVRRFHAGNGGPRVRHHVAEWPDELRRG
jgi:MFS family permease